MLPNPVDRVALSRWLEENIASTKEAMKESRKAGVNSAGFNYDLGQLDALKLVKDWLEEDE